MDKGKFKHSTVLRVRNFEVDWQGIVHNSVYLQYFEVGRIEYLRLVGVKVDLNTIRRDSRIVLARNEVDYLSPARFDDELTIWTRIVYIRNSSFLFEGIVEETKNGRVIAENAAVHVWLDARTGRPTPVADEFRSMVRKFEGESFSDLQPPVLT